MASSFIKSNSDKSFLVSNRGQWLIYMAISTTIQKLDKLVAVLPKDEKSKEELKDLRRLLEYFPDYHLSEEE